MMPCEHTKQIGDNYGVSCQSCGTAVEGFGYGGFYASIVYGGHCLHGAWYKIGGGKEECLYCHQTRERA
jgi:hypothetical protein